jgi:hypothetical protein
LPNPFAKQGVIINEDNLDHEHDLVRYLYCDFFGVNFNFTRVPPLRLGPTVIVPPRLKARSFMIV